MHFKEGDIVVVTEDFEHDDRQFYKGDTGKVLECKHYFSEPAIKWDRIDDNWLGQATWFVPPQFLALQSESSIVNSPYIHVIRKIKRLQDKRKDLGYAF